MSCRRVHSVKREALTGPWYWLRPEIRELSAYHVPKAKGLIKLDAMENPYRWPQALLEPWLEELRRVELNRYPDPEAPELKACLRAVYGIPGDVSILLGNGSDELIQLILLALSGRDRVILIPEPTFVMYRLLALTTGFRCVGVPLQADTFDLDYDALHDAIARYRPAVIFIAYPNNPTGSLWDADKIWELAHAAPGLVVIDEAYTAFSRASFLQRLGEAPNVVILRTLSKLGLAGLRLGALLGSAEWLAEFDKLRLPYNINVLTQVSARFALEHYSLLEAQIAQIVQARAQLIQDLSGLEHIHAWPSAANFVLFRAPRGRAAAIFDGLRSARILIKNLSGSHALLEDCLRVTVGTPEENDTFYRSLSMLV